MEFRCFEVPSALPLHSLVAAALTKMIEMRSTPSLSVSQLGLQKATRFDSAYVPDISIESYLERISKYSKASASVLLLAFVYIDRIRTSENFILTRLNVHRIFITAVLLATKFYDDEVFKNAFYASLGGVTVKELNILEIDLLNMLKFSLVVSVETYDQYIDFLLDQQRIDELRLLPPSPTSIATDEGGTKSLKPIQSNSSFLNTVFFGNTDIWSSTIEGSAPSMAFYRIPSGQSVAFENDELSCMEVVVENLITQNSNFDDPGPSTAAASTTGCSSRELVMARNAFMASW